MPPTLQRVKDEFSDAGLDPDQVTSGKLARQLEKTLPKYAGVLDAGGQDYEILVLLDLCHHLALTLLGSGINGGTTNVASASAGEVSISYSAVAVDASDPQTWTTWGQQLWGVGKPKTGGLRTSQGPFTVAGKGPNIRFR